MAPMDSDLQTRVAQWAADNPEGAAALRAEGAAQERSTLQAQHDAALSAATAEGARQERERVAAIRAVVPPGYQTVADQAIADGSTPDQAARAVCEAVKAQGETIARSNAEHAPAPVTFAAAPTHQEEAKTKDPDSIDPQVLARRIKEIRAADPSLTIPAAAAQARESLGYAS